MTKPFTDNQTSPMNDQLNQTKREIFYLMSSTNKKFRKWYWPNAPAPAEVNPDLDIEIIRGLAAMKSPHQIAAEIYAAHS